MNKLAVEVNDARDLMPKDGDGFASPFVEVNFEEQKQRTQTKPKDLNPQWNEKLVFRINNPRELPGKSIDVFVYNDGKSRHHKNFLGRVRISGISVPFSEPEATIQRYSLDKRGLFSNVKGDIALRIYAVQDDHYGPPPQHEDGSGNVEFTSSGNAEPPLPVPHLQEINTNRVDEEIRHEHFGDEKMKKKTSKEREVRTFHSIGTGAPGAGGGGPPPSMAYPPPMSSRFGFETHHMKEKEPSVETRTGFARAGPATFMHMQQVPRQNLEFSLVETVDREILEFNFTK